MRITPGGQMPFFIADDGTIVLDDRSLSRPQIAGQSFAGRYDDDPADFGRERRGGRVRKAVGNLKDRRKLRKKQRGERRELRQEQRDDWRSNDSQEETVMSNGKLQPPKGWVGTAVSGRETLTDAGTAKLKITPQHDFLASDLTFQGSLSDARVISVFFGDQPVFNEPDGVPVSVFGSDSLVRGTVTGARLRAGLSITIVGELDSAGTFQATLLGYKPGPSCPR